MTNLFANFQSLFLGSVLAVLVSTGNPCWAQIDPFDSPDDSASAAGEQLEQPEIDLALPESTQLIIRATQESNPRTSIDLAKSIRVMLDINQHDHARYYLNRLQAIPADDQAIFELYEALGSDFFLTLHAVDELQPAGSDFSKRVLATANQIARSPARVQELIKLLSHDDLSIRSSAFRKLKRLGPNAVAQMISVFANPERKSEFVGVRTAMKAMGHDAIGPLIGAARSSNVRVQAEAIYALASYQSDDATDVMMRTYLSPQLPESLRRVALDALTRSNRLPADPREVENRFYQRSRDFLLGRRQLSGNLIGEITSWQWNTTSQQLVSSKSSRATATRIIAAQRAADLYEISPNVARNRQLYLLTQLEAEKRKSGQTSRVDSDSLLKQFPKTNAAELNAILKEAIQLKLVPAATACCEILGEIGKPELLRSIHGKPSQLVEALLLGDRHLQYAAFAAISKIDPQQAYPGSSYMMLMATYMANNKNQATGLVGHIRADVAQSFAASMQIADIRGRSADSSRGFFQAATSDPDLDLMLITDTLDRPDYAELIQQIRSDLRTKRTPIALLYRNHESRLRVQRLVGNDPYFIALPLTLEPEFIASYVQRLRELAKPWNVTALDRHKHAQAAISWLANIANNRQRYRFYNLGSYEKQLVQLLYKPGFAEDASTILVHLGTPSAQRELIKFASQNGLPIDDRKKAVDAFTRQISRGGTILLTKDEIMEQYDRYNASENEPEETQQVLGSILDAFESRAKNSQ